MGKKSKQVAIPQPTQLPTQEKYMGTQVNQDGYTLMDAKRGADGRIITNINTPPQQKATQDFNENTLYTPGQNIYRTVYGSPTVDNTKAQAGYKDYLINLSKSNQALARRPTTSVYGFSNLGSYGGLVRPESYDSWLAKNKDAYTYTPTTQELVGSTPASGLNVDLRDYTQAQNQMATDARERMAGLNTQITQAINDVNVVSPEFQKELQDNMDARMRLASDPYNQQYQDNTMALANNLAKRFGSLNSSAFQANQARIDEAYTKGMADLIDKNLLARSTERNNLAALKQQNLQNLTNDRGYYSGLNNSAGSQLGSALNYFSGNSYTQPQVPAVAMQQVQADQSQNAQNYSNANANYQNQLNYTTALNEQRSKNKPWWQTALQIGGTVAGLVI